ncbi:TetR family transcriptional regulator [Nocardia cyriacigeorgica]|uniref:TetR family transcriptional regulator n=1 Tax=Nocardia cyriacigeorgica TaxID=135487 RepID=A0A6P1D0E5_9NOCA|nr:TetR family transcriptional regulator [Nocardia cyriacigeorgica]NEW43777.1 TetR family transcriptional regulator [Nocardia cyriacigeorgica]NEW50338.1 TetR family transcriptional regulator [Nocardia cyriacigeorgica]NEW54922.1 TetR family transcriptional regulator [Nocardia cyriacigeorgica]
MGLRQQKRQATRAAIVRAATTLFLEHGFAATSITDIAAAAGVSRRTFFLYFPSKEDVLFHHIEEYIQAATGTIVRLDADATPWDAVQAAMATLIDAFEAATARTDELADLRAELFRSTQGLPGSLMARLQSVHTTVLDAIHTRFPDSVDQPATTAHLGACLGATTAAATSTAAGERATAMRAAVRRAGIGFR